MSFDIQYLRDDLYRKLDVEQPGNAPLYIRQDVVQAINQALQTMQLAGGAFFTAETITQAITAGQANYTLDADIQRVIGPVRIDGGPHLRLLRSRGEFDAFGILYQNETGYDAPTGEPRAYLLDSQRAASGEDSVEIVLRVIPTPSAAATLNLDVVKECPHYEADNFCDDPTPVVAVPHKYVETILLPLARFYITRSHWFKNTDLLQRFETDYRAAMVALGLAEPLPNPARKTAPQLEEAA